MHLKNWNCPTTDCNTFFGLPTGACCYTVRNNATSKTTPPTGSNASVIKAITAIFPTATPAYFCSTPDMLKTVPGYAGGVTTVMGQDAILSLDIYFAGPATGTNPQKARLELVDATATWICSGASTLAASGATIFALISLMWENLDILRSNPECMSTIYFYLKSETSFN